jgi:hypothetical protein
MAFNKPQADILSKLTKEELLDVVDTLQKNFWNLQNNWMAYMSREYGEEAAVRADGHCFGANAKVQAYRFKRLLGLGDDLDAVMDAIVLSTIFANGEYETWKVDDTHRRLRVTNCLQQVRRLEDGMGELPCKSAGLAICEAAAHAINPVTSVTCIACPPDRRPAGVWCEWEFALAR